MMETDFDDIEDGPMGLRGLLALAILGAGIWAVIFFTIVRLLGGEASVLNALMTVWSWFNG